MTKSNIFIGITISFAAGVLLASIWDIPQNYLYIFLAITVAGFAFIYISSLPRLAPVLALFLFCAGLGALRLQISDKSNEYQDIFGQKQQIEGYIVEDIDARIDKQMITFQPKGHQQRILITTTKTSQYYYGDWIVVQGKVAEPQSFEDFDYAAYLRRYDVYALMRYPKILVLKNHQGNIVKEQLLNIKYSFTRRINQVLQEPKSSLLLGILIGARKGLPQDITDNFTTAGLSHVVAVSGYNISIIIGALGGILAGLFGRKASLWLSLLLIFGFVIIAGASASVIRAAFMGILLLLSFNLGRLYAIIPSIMLAGLAMIIINPKILYWDVGFQLSFLATLGIIYFVPVLEKLTENWPKLWKVKEILFTTMAAIVATLPLILYNFGRLSTVAPLANILVLPIVPAVMLFGFLSFLPFIGPGFALIANWLLAYIIKVSQWLSRLPFASLEIHISWVTFLLLVLAVVLLYKLLEILADKPSFKVDKTGKL